MAHVAILEDRAVMHVHEGEGHAETYRPLINAIGEYGQDITVRGMATREILNNVLVIRNPLKRIIHVPGRYWSPWAALSETLWILSGRNDVKSLTPFNSRMVQFSDDGYTLSGAYGYRIKLTVQSIVKMLQSDPNTRRAVIPIYKDQDIYLFGESKDIPCNTSIMFKIRDNKLHMTVTNRSNDLHWGLFGINLFAFSVLQEAVANAVGVGIGSQVHVSQSLHYYLNGAPGVFTVRMKENLGIPLSEEYTKEMPFFGDTQLNWGEIVDFSDYALLQNTLALNSEKMPPIFHDIRYFLFLYIESKGWQERIDRFGEFFEDVKTPLKLLEAPAMTYLQWKRG